MSLQTAAVIITIAIAIYRYCYVNKTKGCQSDPLGISCASKFTVRYFIRIQSFRRLSAVLNVKPDDSSFLDKKEQE